MGKRLFINRPGGFSNALLDELEEKYGIRVFDEETSSADATADSASVRSSDTISCEEPVVQDAQFLQLPPHILARIASKLDAHSFVALAFSCDQLYNFYRQPSAENKVAVPLWWELRVYGTHDGHASSQSKFELMANGVFMKTSRCVNCVLNWPFSIHIRLLKLKGNVFPKTLELLTEMKAQSVYKVKMLSRVEFQDLITLIDEYQVKSAEWEWNGTQQRYSEEEIKALLQKPFERLSILHAEGRLLHDITIPQLVVSASPINPADLLIIVNKFLTTDSLVDWALDRDAMSQGDFMSCLSEQHPLYHVNFSGPLPQQRPLAFFSHGNNDNHLIYYFLREDGKIVSVTNPFDQFYIRISFVPLAEAPAIVSRV